MVVVPAHHRCHGNQQVAGYLIRGLVLTRSLVSTHAATRSRGWMTLSGSSTGAHLTSMTVCSTASTGTTHPCTTSPTCETVAGQDNSHQPLWLCRPLSMLLLHRWIRRRLVLR